MISKNIRVCVNAQQWLTFGDQTPLAALIEQLALPNQQVAVAVNNEIVTQDAWVDWQLSDNDQVSVFSAIAGG